MVSVRRGQQILAKSRQNIDKVSAESRQNIGKIYAKIVCQFALQVPALECSTNWDFEESQQLVGLGPKVGRTKAKSIFGIHPTNFWALVPQIFGRSPTNFWTSSK